MRLLIPVFSFLLAPAPAPTPTPTPTGAIVPAFYVATDGSDTNSGTVTAPFKTLAACQKAMQGSSTIKTCYLRAGTYTGAYLLLTGPQDNGETWTYYPPDGVDTAILDGQSTVGDSGGTPTPNGVDHAIDANNISNVSIIGLQFERYQDSAFSPHIGTNLVFNFNVVHDLTSANWSGGAVAPGCVVGMTIQNNYMYNLAYTGVEVETGINGCPTGGMSNTLVSGNVFINTCTYPDTGNDQNGADCGAIYFWDMQSPSSTNIVVTNNFIRDVNNVSGGSGGRGIYIDDGVSNTTSTGNIITGVYEQCFQVHGGNNNVSTSNICDLGSNGQTFINNFQSDRLNYPMSGNEFEGNIIVAAMSGVGYGFSFVSPPTQPVIQNNVYYNYVGSSFAYYSAKPRFGQDSHPIYENPDISCWIPQISPASPVFSSPVNFMPIIGGWGPPGFTIPNNGTPPSWPHGC
jgi:hypothetical protein